MSDSFTLAENKHTHTIFFVDEASMIANSNSESGAFGSGRLLDDLVRYVQSGKDCRLVLMGDGAQLPPVGQSASPALDDETLKGYGFTVYSVHLKTIARQAAQSGILHNATILRNTMEEGADGMNETIVITRSNRRAAMFNMGIRGSILYREEVLVNGDMLLVSKNNYYWTADYDNIDFIANGDIVKVMRVWGEIESRYGLQFANVTLQFPDHNNLEVDSKVIIDTLTSDAPALTAAQNEALYNGVMAELTGDKRSRYRELKKNPYFNALQVKFAYAVTCHKAQGGGWRNVFVDMGNIMPDALTPLDFYRWFYTAITRAQKRVYLINCPLPTDNTDNT